MFFRLAIRVASCLLLVSAAMAQERVALVIGNGEYQHSSRLANPRNDATDIAGALRDIGFDVIEGSDLDRRGMEQKIRAFSDKLETARLAVFFYAGHGLQVAGKNYLVPTDAKLSRPGDLSLDAIDIKVVLDQMESAQRINLVFLDACRDNPLSRRFAGRLGAARSQSVGQGLATISSAIGTMIAFATQPDAVALDGSGRNSPFSEALVKHIKTQGADISEVMRRVRRDVIQATGQAQVPWDHSSLTDTVVLVPKGPAVGGPLIAPAPVPVTAPAAQRPSHASIAPNPAASSPRRSLWEHNGSVMYLQANGAERKFFYDQPRDFMLRAGARNGTLLFDGRKQDKSYVGTARIFAGECGAFPYSVSGPISEDQRTVVMSGQAPRIDPSSCRIIGYRDDRLVFEFQDPR
jgi:hypothetical protein